MSEFDACTALARAYCFVGNSLLKPMSQTGSIGLSQAFWEEFPCFGDEGVACVVECARDAAAALATCDNPVQTASVEHARLFVGPPHPAAAPWESYYLGGRQVSSGFGQPTFEMQALLREHGLELAKGYTQLADHMGIELLLLGELVQKAHSAEQLDEADAFATAHPLRWIGCLRERVEEEIPGCYLGALLALAESLMLMQVS